MRPHVMYTLLLSITLSVSCVTSLWASPRANALLDTIDVFLTVDNMKTVGLTAEHAERVLIDIKQRRYRRVRALGALSILNPTRAQTLLPELLVKDTDSEVRAQAAIHLVRVFYTHSPARVLNALNRARAERSSDVQLLQLIESELKRVESP